jgi:hypothetical protein
MKMVNFNIECDRSHKQEAANLNKITGHRKLIKIEFV